MSASGVPSAGQKRTRETTPENQPTDRTEPRAAQAEYNAAAAARRAAQVPRTGRPPACALSEIPSVVDEIGELLSTTPAAPVDPVNPVNPVNLNSAFTAVGIPDEDWEMAYSESDSEEEVVEVDGGN